MLLLTLKLCLVFLAKVPVLFAHVYLILIQSTKAPVYLILIQTTTLLEMPLEAWWLSAPQINIYSREMITCDVKRMDFLLLFTKKKKLAQLATVTNNSWRRHRWLFTARICACTSIG
jgi:hypothetical protein